MLLKQVQSGTGSHETVSAHFTPKVGVFENEYRWLHQIPKLLQTWDFNRNLIALLYL